VEVWPAAAVARDPLTALFRATGGRGLSPLGRSTQQVAVNLVTEVVTPLAASNPARLQSKLTYPEPISIATDNASLSRAAAPPLRAAQQFGSEALVARASARPCELHNTGVVGLTVLKPKFLEQFPDARFPFKSGRIAQQGTFKGVWLNAERTEWALEKEQQ
jgi:hypothetical protein